MGNEFSTTNALWIQTDKPAYHPGDVVKGVVCMNCGAWAAGPRVHALHGCPACLQYAPALLSMEIALPTA